MGGKSTSQRAVLSGGKTNKSSGFDLHSWQGLTQVLKKGKESLKDPESYAEFRNLVLEYAQGGGEPELRNQIDKVISSFDKESFHAKQDNSPKKKKHIIKNQHKHTKVIEKKDEHVEQNNKPSTPSKPLVQNRIKPFFKPPVPKVDQGDIKTDIKTTRPNDIEKPQAPIVKEEKKVIVNKEPADKPTVQANNNPEASTEISEKSGDHKARIVEIKRLVHEKIGNPAALMSTHNDLGKKYMMALLAALKATGAGSGENPDTAMSKLEDAYKALINAPEVPEAEEKIVEKPKETEIESNILPSQPKPDIPLEEKPTPPKHVDIPKKPEPVKQVDLPKDPVVVKTSSPTSEIKRAPFEAKPIEKKEEPHIPNKEIAPVTNTEEKEDVPLRKPVDIKIHAQTKKEIEEDIVDDTDDERPSLSPVSTLKALLKEEDVKASPEEKVKEPSENVDKSDVQIQHTKHTKKGIGTNVESGYRPLDAVDPMKSSIKQTELSSPKVSEALDQLLHEWQIFKSSGILGIGPGGSEHPLYKKLAPLSMGEVVSGRWEGSDRKSTKIIKEYVDAWRHEQGIAYNIQETFDHYLRRVVLRIQQRQSENE